MTLPLPAHASALACASGEIRLHRLVDVRPGDIWAGRLSGGRHVIYRVEEIRFQSALCRVGKRRKHMPRLIIPLFHFRGLDLVRRDGE